MVRLVICVFAIKEYPSFFSLEGRVIDFSEEQLQKAKRSMVVIASSSSTLVREEHPEKKNHPDIVHFWKKEIFFQSSTVAERTGLNIDIGTTFIVVRKRNGREGSTV